MESENPYGDESTDNDTSATNNAKELHRKSLS